MKRFFSIISVLLLLSAFVFADEDSQGDVYDDGYVYEQNGMGDQFVKIDLGVCLPLNFKGQLYPGIAANVGYYYFLSKYFAVGGDATIGYNYSIGQKPLTTVPLTVGGMIQPYFGKFEFPIMFTAGIATTTLLDKTYFPSFAAKFSVGAFYRYSETWSFGLSSVSYVIPHWFISEPQKNDVGIFTSVNLSVRYHF